MTFDDDLIVLNFEHKPLRQSCKELGIEWPPPEYLHVLGFKFQRIRLSGITDEQRSTMTNICRGAEYELIAAVEVNPSKLQ